MLNFNPELVPTTKPHESVNVSSAIDWTPLQRNQRAIERHVNDDHYVRSFGPGQATLESTATLAVVGSRWGVVVLPNAATTSALWTFTRPAEWVSGKIMVRFWYSSDGGSTNNFVAGLQVGVAAAGDAMHISTLILNTGTALTVAGPAAANTSIRAADVYTTANVTRAHELINVRVYRVGADAADTNANNLHIYAVRLQHVPAFQEAT